MLVKFHSDKLISHTGFRAQYTAGQSLYLNSSAEILSWGLGFISYNLNLYTGLSSLFRLILSLGVLLPSSSFSPSSSPSSHSEPS